METVSLASFRSMDNPEISWSEAVEDLVDGGDIHGAISLLESTVSKLEETPNRSSSSDLKLSSALTDLANLYSARGLSTKSDELRTRAFLIKQRAQKTQHSLSVPESVEKKELEETRVSTVSNASDSAFTACNIAPASNDEDDDWEAVADRGPIEVFTPQIDERVSKLSLEDKQLKTPKRRGRGSFMYKKNGLYSDQQPDVAINDESDDEFNHHKSEENTGVLKVKYGTNHVLVLADFPPSTRTTDLEKVFDKFRDRGLAIRWVNDTVALAVFRTPSIAAEARDTIQCPFKVGILSEDDSIILGSISTKDLDPPVPRPKTSVRTAERLIAQGMGRKISSTKFGASELRKQEEARRNRIITRQTLRDDAWGADD